MSDRLKADVLSAFNGGELTPELSGRVDKEELKFGTRYSSNFVPTHQGGLSKWCGTTKIATIPINVSSEYKLVPFNGASEPLALLFCAGNVYSVCGSEIYLQRFNILPNQISDASYLQINDLIYFASPSAGLYQIQYFGVEDGHHIFNLLENSVKEEPFFPYSWSGNYNKAIRTYGYRDLVTVEAIGAISGYYLKLPERLANPGVGINVLFGDQIMKCITAGTSYNTPSSTVTTGATTIKLIRIRGGVETEVISANVGTRQTIGG